MACFQSRVGVKKSMETDKVDSADPNLGYHNPVTEPQLKIHFAPPFQPSVLEIRQPKFLLKDKYTGGGICWGPARGSAPFWMQVPLIRSC